MPTLAGCRSTLLGRIVIALAWFAITSGCSSSEDHGSDAAPGDAQPDARVPEAPAPDGGPPGPHEAPDASSDASTSVEEDAGVTQPFAYMPDGVTMAQDLPSVLPVMRIDIGGQTVEKDVEITGQLELFETHDGTLDDLDTVTPTLSAPIAFEGRGNFTWTLPKKGYAFELQDGAGNAQAHALMGMPRGSDFALYACYTDKTCMRNALVYALGQRLGRYSPRARYVELFLDGEYQGLYMVWERIRKDRDRVRLAKPALDAASGDLSGGYVFRHEGAGKNPPAPSSHDFVTTSGIIYSYHYPNEDEISAEQKAYLQGAVQTFEDALAAVPAQYAQWIEEASWVDHAIVEEVTNNWDGYVHSIYMIKRPDAEGGLIEMGPLWDFDLAFGNGNVTGYNCRTDNWAYQIERPAPDDVPDYWRSLYAEPRFQTAWKCRYRELREDALSLATIDAQLAAWKAYTEAARARDQAKWATLPMWMFPNCVNPPPFDNTYDKELSYLREFIAARLAWLDQQAQAMPGACE